MTTGGLGVVFALAMAASLPAQEQPASPANIAAELVGGPHRDGDMEWFPIALGTVFTRHDVYAEGAEPGSAAGASEILIYDNSLAQIAMNIGTSLVSDDIATVGATGCRLRRIEFPVTGKVNPAGIGGPYTVEFRLFSTCPGGLPLVIPECFPGTCGQASFPDDAPRLINFVLPGTGIALPTNWWFGVKFSRSNAGVLVGSPASRGASCDVLDRSGFPCSGTLGGFPQNPHASFNLRLYGDADTCTPAFDGYKNIRPTGPIFNPGQDATLVDDIRLGVPNCQMVGYEVAVRGLGFFQFDMRRNCEGPIIAGSEKVYNGTDSTTQIARFGVTPPVALSESFFFATRVNNAQAGIVVSGVQACVGSTEDIFLQPGETDCVDLPFPDPVVHDAVNLTIICAGSPPVGACCDMLFTDEAGEAVCREVPQMNCPWPWPPWTSTAHPQWAVGQICESDPFLHPCGVSACCRPDDACENLSYSECMGIEPLDAPRQWQRGQYCGFEGQVCLHIDCIDNEGDCTVAHPDGACHDLECCRDVCALDSYCCQVEWDRACVNLAAEQCDWLADHDNCWWQPNPYFTDSALLVAADSNTYFSNATATSDVDDPGFTCYAEFPNTTSFGTVWFRFVATDTSATISTLNSIPEGDSLVQVFAVGDPTSEATACATLHPIACGDDLRGCPATSEHSRFCVRGLIPGDTYYVVVGSKSYDDQGAHQLDIASPCAAGTDDCDADGILDECEPDCNHNDFPDDCDITTGRSNDCNHNVTPDECDVQALDCNGNLMPDDCDIGSGRSHDCNGSTVPDECDIAVGFSRDCQPNSVPDECDLAAGSSGDCNGDKVPDECAEFRQTIGHDPSSRAFGQSVAIEGDLILIGDPDVDDFAGAAHLFRRNGSFWTHEGELMPGEEEFYWLGLSVAIAAGDAYVVGAWDNPNEGIDGAVFVFHRAAKGWEYQDRITVDDPAQAYHDVCYVEVDGDHAVVSACYNPPFQPPKGPLPAIIYAFRREGQHWVQEAKLTGVVSSPESAFGQAVALACDWIAIGAWGDIVEGIEAGAVYTYRRHGGKWLFAQKLTVPQSRSFGAALDLQGERMAITSSREVQPGMFVEEAVIMRRSEEVWHLESRVSGEATFTEVSAGLTWWEMPSIAFANEATVVMATYGGRDGMTFGNVLGRSSAGDWVNVGALRDAGGFPAGLWHVVVAADADSSAVGISSLDRESSGTVRVFAVPLVDCNENGKGDSCDLVVGGSVDCNNNGLPDECDGLIAGDADFDGDVDLWDVSAFLNCYTGSVGACCYVDDSNLFACEDLTRRQCAVLAPELSPGGWRGWQRCGVGGQSCVFPLCEGATGDCWAAHPSTGCDDEVCCSLICSVIEHEESYCCMVEWDDLCAKFARESCPPPPQRGGQTENESRGAPSIAAGAPASPSALGVCCGMFDQPSDGDVDREDWGAMQGRLAGP